MFLVHELDLLPRNFSQDFPSMLDIVSYSNKCLNKILAIKGCAPKLFFSKLYTYILKNTCTHVDIWV